MKVFKTVYFFIFLLVFSGCSESRHAGSGVQYDCDNLSEDELTLFRVIHVWGASNTSLDNYFYPKKIIIKIHERLAGCLDYKIGLIYDNKTPLTVTSDVKLSMSLDAFYWPAVDYGNTDDINDDIIDKLDTLFNEMSDGGRLIVGIIPGALLTDYDTADRDGILDRIKNELGNYPDAVTIDLDSIYTDILSGHFYYNDSQVSIYDIMQDFIHLNSFGHQIMADLFIGEINSIWPNLDIPAWGIIEIRD